MSFNPRPRTGSDNPSASVPPGAYRFNPRPRTGSDYAKGVVIHLYQRFNPRPRTGSDRGVDFRIVGGAVSIHAPARGATVL